MILLEEKDISAQCDPKTKRVPRLQFDYLDFLYILIFCTYSQALLRHLPREMEMRDVELADTKMGVTHQVTVEATFQGSGGGVDVFYAWFDQESLCLEKMVTPPLKIIIGK